MGVIKETLIYSRYEVTEEVRSRIDSDVSNTKVVGWRCPKCKDEKGRELRHAETKVCNVCGLVATRYGNALVCTLKVATYTQCSSGIYVAL
jgi:hypothetical protein